MQGIGRVLVYCMTESAFTVSTMHRAISAAIGSPSEMRNSESHARAWPKMADACARECNQGEQARSNH